MKWYYELAGQQQGPVPEYEIESLLASGKITPETAVGKGLDPALLGNVRISATPAPPAAYTAPTPAVAHTATKPLDDLDDLSPLGTLKW